MNPPAPARRRQIWPWILGLILAPFVVLGTVVASVFHLDADAAALRRQLASGAGRSWDTKVQLTVPAAGLGLARTAACFFHQLPPEARDGLAAVRSASVGVYSRHGTATARPGGSLIADTDRMMAGRGWTRIVGVIDGGNTVLIYLPAGDGAAPPDRACLAVSSGEDLVVVAAHLNGRALARLVNRAVEQHTLARL